MAQKEPRTFEEYNFQEFLKTKQENETLKNTNKELQNQVDFLTQSQTDLIKLCKQVASIITIEKEDEKKAYKTIKVGGQYGTLYFDDDIKYQPLEKFLEIMSAIPSREKQYGKE